DPVLDEVVEEPNPTSKKAMDTPLVSSVTNAQNLTATSTPIQDPTKSLNPPPHCQHLTSASTPTQPSSKSSLVPDLATASALNRFPIQFSKHYGPPIVVAVTSNLGPSIVQSAMASP
ncbi:hypothetical protein KI387_010329, partial [Taxus chinensis]